MHNIAGIDYGHGKTNIDTATGIRYGVISLNTVMSEYLNDFESIYPEIDRTPDSDADHDDGYDIEPSLFRYTREGLVLEYSPDSSFVWVFSSPYVTETKFCSPCVPGAGDLDNPINGGVLTYCLPDDWFESGKAPYEYRKL